MCHRIGFYNTPPPPRPPLYPPKRQAFPFFLPCQTKGFNPTPPHLQHADNKKNVCKKCYCLSPPLYPPL